MQRLKGFGGHLRSLAHHVGSNTFGLLFVVGDYGVNPQGCVAAGAVAAVVNNHFEQVNSLQTQFYGLGSVAGFHDAAVEQFFAVAFDDECHTTLFKASVVACQRHKLPFLAIAEIHFCAVGEGLCGECFVLYVDAGVAHANFGGESYGIAFEVDFHHAVGMGANHVGVFNRFHACRFARDGAADNCLAVVLTDVFGLQPC